VKTCHQPSAISKNPYQKAIANSREAGFEFFGIWRVEDLFLLMANG